MEIDKFLEAVRTGASLDEAGYWLKAKGTLSPEEYKLDASLSIDGAPVSVDKWVLWSANPPE